MSITPYVPPSFLSTLPTAIWSGADGLPVLPFLPGQAIAVTKAPKWSTEVIRAASGRQRRTAYWPYPLWDFELQYEVIRHRPTADELAAMWEFFNVAKGQFASFLFVDPTDCAVPTSVLQDPATGNPLTDPSTGAFLTDPGSAVGLGFQFGVGDGATRTFQLSRFVRSWFEPVYATFNVGIADNGAPAGAFTVAAGQVTFTTAPAAGHTLQWFGWFYFGCNFTQDDLGFVQIVTQLWEGKSLKFTSNRR
ncbi:MAG TPA: DUF2460 domain-containing protein [Caulobacteraceae bacterium]|jgi:hypothetical protein